MFVRQTAPRPGPAGAVRSGGVSVRQNAPAAGPARTVRSAGPHHVAFDETAGGRVLEAQARAYGDRAAVGFGPLRPGDGRRTAVRPTGPPPGLSAGEPLSEDVRAAMEGRLGFDFAAVRVHAGPRAAAEAAGVGARAYTMGSHIVFGASRYRPDLLEGRRLLAHELAHVVQQASGLGVVLQRDKDPAAPLPSEPVRQELARREAEWQALRAVAATEPSVKRWIDRGDEVVGLLRAHTEAALAAMAAADNQLLHQYRAVIETDVVAYRYVGAHVLLYTHLAKLRSRAHSIVASFDADKRAFTGRKRAEEETRVLATYTDAAERESAGFVTLVRTDVRHQLASATGAVPVTLTSAADARYRSEMQAETANAIDLESKVSLLVVDILDFLATARAEGMAQAVEAVEEYYKVKGIIDRVSGGLQKEEESPKPTEEEEPRSEKRPEPEPLPHPVPAPVPAPGEEEDEKKREPVFRAMKDDGGHPKVEASARGLGVRVPPNQYVDVDVVDGVVKANRKGMSMGRFTPFSIIESRRPPEWGGTGPRDAMWATVSAIFTGPLTYHPDTPTHANAAAAFDMPVDAMQGALAATRPAWTKVPPPTQAEKKPAATRGTTPLAPAAGPPEKAPR